MNKTAVTAATVSAATPRPSRLSPIAAAFATAFLFGPVAAHAALIFETEPNNTLATANLTVAGNEFQGEADQTGSLGGPDFLGFIGLVSGATYKLTLAHINNVVGGLNSGTIFFDLFLNGSTTSSQTQSFTGPGSADFSFSGLSDLRVGARINANCCEGYSIALVQTAAAGAAPEPATAALIAAGLVSAFAARRRRRH